MNPLKDQNSFITNKTKILKKTSKGLTNRKKCCIFASTKNGSWPKGNQSQRI